MANILVYRISDVVAGLNGLRLDPLPVPESTKQTTREPTEHDETTEEDARNDSDYESFKSENSSSSAEDSSSSAENSSSSAENSSSSAENSSSSAENSSSSAEDSSSSAESLESVCQSLDHCHISSAVLVGNIEVVTSRGPIGGVPSNYKTLKEKNDTTGCQYYQTDCQDPPQKVLRPNNVESVPFQPSQFQGVPYPNPQIDERNFHFSDAPPISFSAFTMRDVLFGSNNVRHSNATDNGSLYHNAHRFPEDAHRFDNRELYRGLQPSFQREHFLNEIYSSNDFPFEGFRGNEISYQTCFTPTSTQTGRTGSNEVLHYPAGFCNSYAHLDTQDAQCRTKPAEITYHDSVRQNIVNTNPLSAFDNAQLDLDEIFDYIHSDPHHRLPSESEIVNDIDSIESSGHGSFSQQVQDSMYSGITPSPGVTQQLNLESEDSSESEGDKFIRNLIKVYHVDGVQDDIRVDFNELFEDEPASLTFPSTGLYPVKNDRRLLSVESSSLSPSYYSSPAYVGPRSNASSSDYNSRSPGRLSDRQSICSGQSPSVPSVPWPSSVSSDHSSSFHSPGGRSGRRDDKSISEAEASPGRVFAYESPEETDEDTNEKTMKMAHACRRAAGFTREELLALDEEGDTVLHSTMINDDWYLVEALLERYKRENNMADIVDVQNHDHQTPLCLAVIFNKPDVIETLLANGADVNVQMRRTLGGQMGVRFDQPLHFAARRGNVWLKTLRKLVGAEGVDLNAFNSGGQTPLHCAIEAHRRLLDDSQEQIDSKQVMTLLAIQGADLNKPDGPSEKTPLHYAIEKKDIDLVAKLLHLADTAKDQRINSVGHLLSAKTGAGNSALHLAVSITMDLKDHKKLVQKLLSSGADPSCKNTEGQLPREVARNQEIVELLKGKGSGRPSARC